MNNGNRQKLNPIGITGHYVVQNNQDNTTVRFRFNVNLQDETTQENFSELNVLNFVVNSYKNSCLYMANIINKNQSKKRSELLSLYIPLNFCFRHYLELKLKLLYSDFTDETFLFDHSFSDLTKDLKNNANYKANIFDAPIKYIENIEKGYPEHFRYLMHKDKTTKRKIFTEEIIMPNNIGETIINFINHIETGTQIERLNRLSTNK